MVGWAGSILLPYITYSLVIIQFFNIIKVSVREILINDTNCKVNPCVQGRKWCRTDRVSQKTWEFSDEFDIVFLDNSLI